MRIPHIAAALLLIAASSVAAQEKPDGELPVTWQNGALMVDVYVNGRGPYSFILDTGTSAVAIDRALAAELGLKKAG
jgi:predicted aspartyl protease